MGLSQFLCHRIWDIATMKQNQEAVNSELPTIVKPALDDEPKGSYPWIGWKYIVDLPSPYGHCS